MTVPERPATPFADISVCEEMTHSIHSTLSSFSFFSKRRIVDWRLRDRLAQVLVFMACCGTSHAKSVFRLLAWVHFRFEKGFKCVLADGGVCYTVVMTLCCRQVTERPVL